MKRICIFIFALTFLFICACSPHNEITYSNKEKGDYVKSYSVKKSKPYNSVSAEVLIFDEEEILKRTDLVVKGTILSETEIALEEYRENKLYHTYYRGVFELEINHVFEYKDAQFKKGDIIRIGNAVCSKHWYEGSKKLEKGKEYILFLRKAIDTETVKFSQSCDYYVLHPWQSIVTIKDNKYEFDEAFISLKENAMEKVNEEYTWIKYYKKDKAFESELQNLLKKKGGESK